MNKIDFSIVIPNYNGKHLFQKNFSSVVHALQHYEEKTKYHGEIILVDDASTDDSTSFIKSLIKKYNSIQTQLIESEKNAGFASTVNIGVAHAQGNVVVLLNSDVSPEKSFLLPLLNHFSDASIFAVGCMDKSTEGEKTILRGRGVGTWKRGFLIHRKGEVDKKNTLWVSGGSGAFRKAMWDRLEGMDTLFNPFYWEDIDLSYRALKTGFKLIFEPASIVVHSHEEGIIKKTFSKEYVKTIAYRNQFIFTWKNITDMLLIVSHIIWLPYHIVSALYRGDMAFIKAFFLAFLLVPNIIQLRLRHNKNFCKSDSEVVIE